MWRADAGAAACPNRRRNFLRFVASAFGQYDFPHAPTGGTPFSIASFSSRLAWPFSTSWRSGLEPALLRGRSTRAAQPTVHAPDAGRRISERPAWVSRQVSRAARRA
ncbi:hypothetical protein C7S16_6326 [Burkholderia thailandensis]|uniref:Uncharacterized protein n=1 Tax=Burkholderia thailandensis TaxID=57975 RepID=A0AAW9CUZ4_BURTH|nr:hypothetical protein [Burkholderia thailandensis]